MKQTKWYKNAVFYELSIKTFYDSNNDGIGDIPGVTAKLDYLQELGIDCIWLLPFYPSPLKDDGYDISDYYSISPEYGTIADFKIFIKEAHKRNLRVITDLVINHTSDQHMWFQESRKGEKNKYSDWYVWSDSDKKYKDARIIFLDTETSNWEYDPWRKQYFWHRFYASQPDLNYDNPEVQNEILNIMAYWLDLGIDGFRVDAVPYLYQREGTNCENLPETHQYLKKMRRYLDENWPEAIILCEANQPPEDVIHYFGDDNEFHMGFNFPLMPRLFMMLKDENPQKLIDIIKKTPKIPENCQWCTFLRNHDELTLEMVSEEERQWMWEKYAPDKRMRLNLGIRRRLAPLLDNDPAKIILANRILFTLPGAPTIYYGDEIGMGENIQLFDRNGVRTPMQWSDAQNAGFSKAESNQLFLPIISSGKHAYKSVNVEIQKKNEQSMLNRMIELINIRKENPVLADGEITFYPLNNQKVLAYERANEKTKYLVLHNLSDKSQKIEIKMNKEFPFSLEDIFHPYEEKIRIGNNSLIVELPPYESKLLK